MKASLSYGIIVCLALSSFTRLEPPATVKAPMKGNVAVFNSKETEYNQLQQELKQLDQQKKQVLDQLKAFDEKQKQVLAKVQSLENYYNGVNTTGGQQQLLEATQNMQETQMSFNLQYLQLQSSMQNENRQFSMVSNIMKTKHDTAKNSIGNVR